jgi:hypothetical protein
VTPKPIWLLDIDGVINASPEPLPLHVWNEDEWIVTKVLGGNRWWTITAALPVIKFLHFVYQHDYARIRWLTTWQRDAHNVSDALGLPRFVVLENPMVRSHRVAGKQWWKLAEVFKQLDTERPVIWTDDDIGREVRSLARDFHGPELPSPLLIAPKSSEGLGPWHLQQIAGFLGFDYEQAVK